MPNLDYFLSSVNHIYFEKNEKRDIEYFNNLFNEKIFYMLVKEDVIKPGNVSIKNIEYIPNKINLNEKKCIDLLSDNKKIIIHLNQSFFHFIYEALGVILLFLTLYPNLEIIFIVEHYNKFVDFVNFTLKAFDDYKIKYKLIRLNEEMLINNFFSYNNFMTYKETKNNFNLDIIQDFRHVNFAELIYNFFKPYLNYVKIPEKKVLVSRKKVPKGFEPIDRKYFIKPKYFSDKKRIDSEEELEKTFINLGYEIVYPEDFKSFEEQINYFHNVKKMVSLTGSGMTNCIFMKPQGTVIEINTALLIYSQNGYIKDLVQDLGWCMSYFKEHIHISIPNTKKSSYYIDLYINENKKLKEMLEE
jgi:hypothetical protein